MRTLLQRALRLGVAGSLLLVPTAAAHADPPEGCVGFPAISQAWICVTSFTPENQTPTPGTSPGQTFTVPAFCAFDQCVGPTPVTLPGVYVGQGEGAIAVISYDGDTYPVPVIQAPTMTFTATLHDDCVGCGATLGTFDGSFTGVINGHSYVNAAMTTGRILTIDELDTCPLAWRGTAQADVTIADGVHSDWSRMDLLYFGSVVEFNFNFAGTFVGEAAGTRIAASGSGSVCGEAIDYLVAAAGETVINA